MEMSVLRSLVEALSEGRVRVIDLTQPLSEATPVLQLPPPFANTPGWKTHLISEYDERGPAWYWNWFEGGEHVGTHFDAPNHWITGRDREDVASVPLPRLIAPAMVIDRSSEAARDPDYLLTREEVEAFLGEHGGARPGSWLLYRTGWDARAHHQALFLNADAAGSHTPGVTPDCARWLAEESPFVGLGVETVGTDAGVAHAFDPPFPCHAYLLGAGKYGLTQLANLALLPPTGALLIVLPLKLVRGSGSPCRAVALVESG